MLYGLTSMVLRLIGLGAVLAAVSEVWFYPVALNAHVIWLCAFYGPLAYTAWLVMAHFKVRSWAGAIWGACLMGFFIEGIPVPVLYETLPFTILWTSIAWHAIISAALGLWGFRLLSAQKSPISQAAIFGLAGAYLGAWSVELWSLQSEGWIWTPTLTVARQLFVGWALFVVGHVALDLAARFTAAPLRLEIWGFAALTTAGFAAGMLLAVFPLSLVLPILTALSVWVMRRDGQGVQSQTSPFLVRLSNLRVLLHGYLASLMIPVTATLAYHALRLADVRLESAAIHILWVGPVSLVLLVISVVVVLRNRGSDHSQ